MKSLVWQQNRYLKVFYRLGGLYICAEGLDILKFEQTSLFYSASHLNSGIRALFRGFKPIKDPRSYRTMWQSFSLLFNANDSQNYLGYTICQACKICQNFLFISMARWHNALR